MGDMTIAKLVMTQRDRELRRDDEWGLVDLIVMPLGGVLFLVMAALAIVARIGASIIGLIRRGAELLPQDPVERESG